MMDEYLGNITYDNITETNIHHYVERVEDSGILMANVKDCISLISDTSDATVVMDVFQKIANGNGYMNSSDLITCLCKIPGRASLYRLYRYSDVLIKYLNGSPMETEAVLRAMDLNAERVQSLVKVKNDPVQILNSTLEGCRKICPIIKEFEEFSKYIPDSDRKRKYVETFYENVYETLFQETDKSSEYINQQRKKRVKEAILLKDVTRCNGSRQITWTDIIHEMGMPNTRNLRTECGRLAVKNRRENGIELVKTSNRYLYSLDDKDWMMNIAREAFRKINEPEFLEEFAYSTDA